MKNRKLIPVMLCFFSMGFVALGILYLLIFWLTGGRRKPV